MISLDAPQGEPEVRPQSLPLALFFALRPKQWTKNLLIFAALLFTLDQHHPLADYGRVVLGFFIFCLLSGCTYLLNDIADVEADRRHPKKRFRPIASGNLPIPVALLFATVVAPSLLAVAYFGINPRFFFAALLYAVTTIGYSFRFKHIVLVDVMVLAAGFVIRAASGGFAVGVPASEWLLLCTMLLALFISLSKRRSELIALGNGGSTRRILSDYSIPMLDQMITIVAATCLMSYSLYTFFSKTGQQRPYLMATIPFVIYGLFRYIYLAQQKNDGESPETTLIEDKPLLMNVFLWVVVAVIAILVRR